MNVVTLIGNLAGDPEQRYTKGGSVVCTFRIAISRPGAEGADFFTVVAWGRQAEICNEYLMKGRRVGIEGRLHHSTWTVGDDKEMRSRVEVVAHRVELLGGPRPKAAAVDATAGEAIESADRARDGEDVSLPAASNIDFAPSQGQHDPFESAHEDVAAPTPNEIIHV